MPLAALLASVVNGINSERIGTKEWRSNESGGVELLKALKVTSKSRSGVGHIYITRAMTRGRLGYLPQRETQSNNQRLRSSNTADATNMGENKHGKHLV